MNIIIITGASSGIGMEFANQLDCGLDSIDEFWLVARSREKLQKVSEGLKHHCKIFPIDITNESELDTLKASLYELQPSVRMLINSAGFGIKGSFLDGESKEQTDMVRLNCMALTEISHLVIPYMKRNSRIIQMASSAAFLPEVNFAVYAATKAYVLNFSKALAYELKAKEIYVTTVCPGPVDTPFLTIADSQNEISGLRKIFLAEAKNVVSKAIEDSYKKKLLSVYGISNKFLLAATKLAPGKLVLEISEKFNK